MRLSVPEKEAERQRERETQDHGHVNEPFRRLVLIDEIPRWESSTQVSEFSDFFVRSGLALGELTNARFPRHRRLNQTEF